MKNALILFSVASICLACSSSGVEPNWDAQARKSLEDQPVAELSRTGNYRVEVRQLASAQDESDSGQGVIRMESFQNGVRVRGGSKTSSTETRSRNHSTSFGQGLLGHPISILAGRESFVVVLESAGGASLSATVSQQTNSNPSQGHARGSALRTRVMTPLGRWTALGGISEESIDSSTAWQLGQSSSASGRQGQRHSQMGWEIRVTPR